MQLRHATLLLAVAASLVGCGNGNPDIAVAPSQAPAQSVWQSGERLRAHLLQGDGASVFIAWRDLSLGADCVFHPSADGSWRCLPAPSAAALFYVEPTAYLDNACTRLAFVSVVKPGAWAMWLAGVDACAGQDPFRASDSFGTCIDQVIHRSTN